MSDVYIPNYGDTGSMLKNSYDAGYTILIRQ